MMSSVCSGRGVEVMLARWSDFIFFFYLFFLYYNVVVVALLFYVHGKHLRSCRDGQLT